MASEKEIAKIAKEELLRDAKVASVRAEMFGAHRWAKPKIPVANKRFLKNMLHSGKSQMLDHSPPSRSRRRVVYSTISRKDIPRKKRLDEKNISEAVSKDKKHSTKHKKEHKNKHHKTKDTRSQDKKNRR